MPQSDLPFSKPYEYVWVVANESEGAAIEVCRSKQQADRILNKHVESMPHTRKSIARYKVVRDSFEAIEPA